MSKTLIISDQLYQRLAETARRRGLGIDQLLETWQSSAEDLAKRREAVQTINTLRQQIEARYGQMPDSTELIREDRGR